MISTLQTVLYLYFAIAALVGMTIKFCDRRNSIMAGLIWPWLAVLVAFLLVQRRKEARRA